MKVAKILAGILVVLAVVLFVVKSRINTFQRDGEITLDVLKAPVKVIRDEKGMPYIYAESLADGITAQGFVTAQDRLPQLQGVRLISQGRFAELSGESAIKQDIFFRSLGFLRNAKKHAKILDDESRQFLQWYVNGINAYINKMQNEYPIELKLAKLNPDPWTIEDVLSTLYMVGFTSAGNYKSELLFSKLFEKLGATDAVGLSPVNVGPECKLASAESKEVHNDLAELKGLLNSDIFAYTNITDQSFKVGSNNWVVSPKLTKNNAAILAGDPHLTSNRIPAAWYPVSIITPEYRLVGTTIPGAPGFYSLRTKHIAIGLTNSYIDCQDIYVEILDPENPKNYLEGNTSVPFDFLMETIKVKDKEASSGFNEIKQPIMLSKRGPVIFKNDKIAMTLRWSAIETMSPSLSMYDVLRSKSVEDIKNALEKETIQFFNRSFVDNQGNIGWHTTGRIPLRAQKTGAYPQRVKDSNDNWIGWIPFEEMPNSYNPPQGWIGNANNKTMDDSYPYYLTSHFASYYRFARMKELLNATKDSTPDDHWMYQRDTKNMLAANIAPIMAKALTAFDDTKELGTALSQWDYHDDKEKSAPAIFQIVMNQTAMLTFKDELGEEIAKEMLDDWYYWQTRFEKMILAGESKWFDMKNTEDVETMQDIIHMAGKEAIAQYGTSPKWGDIHKIEILNALIFSGPLKSLVEAGTYPMSGSGQTLYRANYPYNEPFKINYTASMRMVVDMSDNDKVLAVLPGGVSGRIFDKHYNDQTDAFMSGEKMYWWFSDEMIKSHTESTLALNAAN